MNGLCKKGMHCGAKPRVSSGAMECRRFLQPRRRKYMCDRSTIETANMSSTVARDGLVVVETEDPLTAWMALSVCTALTLHMERHSRIGAFLSSPLLAILLSFVASGVLHVLPVGASSVYSAVSTWLLPLGVAMYVLEVDVSKVFTKEMSTMLLAFVLGAFGTIVGTIVSCLVFLEHLGIDGPHVASALCASYIGGSVNFAAVIGGLGTVRAETIPTAMSVDNLVMCLYIACLMFLSYFVSDEEEKQQQTTNEPYDTAENTASSYSLATAIATGLVSTRIAFTGATWLGMPSLGLALVSLVACLAAPLSSFIRSILSIQTIKDTSGVFDGSTSLAGVLMTLFFCTIGAQAGQISMGKESLFLFAFITLQLTVQLLVSLGLGKVCGVPLRTMLIACNANVGGAATAVGMAVSKKWKDLFQPALLAASFGYVIANACGFAMSICIKKYII
mmetsp:Transcript_11183/g.22344  ORF Transcript_11183/g.22344 Transcript_11183/m.22344 type:complete len:448 (+) Transcript_11183:726-2069(+)